MSLTLAFVMDPMGKVNPDTDTSFAFMLAAASRGHRIIHVAPRNLTLEGNECFLRGREINVFDRSPGHYEVVDQVRLPATDCAAIFIRTDPPFDEDYLTVTWILSFAEQAGVRVINSPRGIRNANEHLMVLEFPQLCPPTLISNELGEIHSFVKDVGGQAIIKPIDGHGGFGVAKLESDDTNIKVLIDLLTRQGAQPAMVQKYLPEAVAGDKRLILIDGEVRGCVNRLPGEGDHRGNVHVGGQPVACQHGERDDEIAAALRERLVSEGLFFVGLDVIGDYLIEINVTSPTLIREIKDLGGPDLAAEVIDSVESTAG